MSALARAEERTWQPFGLASNQPPSSRSAVEVAHHPKKSELVLRLSDHEAGMLENCDTYDAATAKLIFEHALASSFRRLLIADGDGVQRIQVVRGWKPRLVN